jgi:hypothetical protein
VAVETFAEVNQNVIWSNTKCGHKGHMIEVFQHCPSKDIVGECELKDLTEVNSWNQHLNMINHFPMTVY